MNKSIAKTIVFIAYFGFILDQLFSIGVDPEVMSRVYFLGIPARDFSLLLMLGVFFLFSRAIFKTTNNIIPFLVGISVPIYLLSGIILNGISNFLIFNADIRTFLWFFGGIAFGFSVLQTKNPKKTIEIIVVLSTFFLILSSIFSAGFREYSAGAQISRIGHPNVYMFAGWLLTTLIILVNISPPVFAKKVIPAISLLSLLFFSAILTGARSMFLACIAIFVFFMISFKFRIRESLLFITKSKLSSRFMILFLIFILSIYFIFYLDVYRVHRFLTLFDFKMLLSDIRVVEFSSFFQQSDLFNLIVGKGFGGSIESPIYNFEPTSTMHIGIMNFWMKLGFFPFLIVFIFLFCKIPLLYIRSYRRFNKNISTKPNAANMLILPSIFPWLLALLISGGFSEINFLMAGFVLYLYGAVKNIGISSILAK